MEKQRKERNAKKVESNTPLLPPDVSEALSVITLQNPTMKELQKAAEAMLHARIVPIALTELLKILANPRATDAVKVNAIAIALRASGLAEKAAQNQTQDTRDLRSLTVAELQDRIDALNAEADARTVDIVPNAQHNAPNTTQTTVIIE